MLMITIDLVPGAASAGTSELCPKMVNELGHRLWALSEIRKEPEHGHLFLNIAGTAIRLPDLRGHRGRAVRVEFALPGDLH
jgi:hypothetical protein